MIRDVFASCVLSAIIVGAGCGSSTDTRPETAAYISEAILVPSCGRAGCHSSDGRPDGLAFDSIPDCLATMQSTYHGQKLVVAGDPDQSKLVTVLTDSKSPMPADSPLPNADIDLITAWVADGAAGLP